MEGFKLIKKIGNGAFGHVFLARKKIDKSLVALKIYYQNVDWENIEISLEYAIEFIHPNLMECRNFFHDRIVTKENELRGKSTVHLFGVFEYIKGKDLFEKTRQIENLDIYLPQIIEGLKYIHSKSLIHFDIKPENILVNEENVVKIIDFDFLTDRTKKIKIKKIGTPLYISPEIFEKGSYNEKTDNWSLGVTLFYCLTGDFPFTGENINGLKKLILSDFTPDFSKIPSKYLQIVKGLLEKNIENRLTLDQVSLLLN